MFRQERHERTGSGEALVESLDVVEKPEINIRSIDYGIVFVRGFDLLHSADRGLVGVWGRAAQRRASNVGFLLQ